MPLSPPARPPAHAARPAAPPVPGLTVEWTGGRVTGASFGVSHEMLRALGRGALRAEATCDLHGLCADVARLQLVRFITGSADRGRRVVLVVCGRGAHSGSVGPVLLDLAITALAEPPLAARVLAFVSAPPALGGQGALLVRLRGLRAARRG
jgi:DNA-nicking Smr family endonuclease